MNHEQENTMEMTYCGQSYHSQGGLVLDCDASDGACPSCLRVHIAKQDAALESALAELADASQCLAMFTDAPATPQAALSAAQAELADIRESTAWLTNVDPDEIRDEELRHAALIDFRRWERISRHPGAVGNPVYSFDDFLIPHARAQGEKKVQAELATATTEIAERDDTIDALRNDIAALRVQLSAARERIREMEDGERDAIEDAEFRAEVILAEWDSGNIVSRGAWMHGDAFEALRTSLVVLRATKGESGPVLPGSVARLPV